MSTRLHIVVSEELLARIDAARGPGQPRSDWIRRVVERALTKADARAAHRAVEQALGDDTQAGAEPSREGAEGHFTRDTPSPTGAASDRGASERPAPAEQPRRSGPDVAAWRRATQK